MTENPLVSAVGSGLLTGIDRTGSGVALRVVLPHGHTVEVDVPVHPDPAAALRHTAGLHRLCRLEVDLGSSALRCRLAGIVRRPVERALPLAAALALAESGVPTVVHLRRQVVLRTADPVDR